VGGCGADGGEFGEVCGLLEGVEPETYVICIAERLLVRGSARD